MAGQFVWSFTLVRKNFRVSHFKYLKVQKGVCEKGGKKGGYLTIRPRTFNK